MKKNSLQIHHTPLFTCDIDCCRALNFKKSCKAENDSANQYKPVTEDYRNSGDRYPGSSSEVIKEAGSVPVYGNWRSFTNKGRLPSDKAYAVRIDGDRVLVGTHDGMAVYEDEKWKTYTTEDGLAHNGVVSIDVDELTGDVWIGHLATESLSEVNLKHSTS